MDKKHNTEELKLATPDDLAEIAELIAKRDALLREQDPFGSWLADESFGVTKDGAFFEIEKG